MTIPATESPTKKAMSSLNEARAIVAKYTAGAAPVDPMSIGAKHSMPTTCRADLGHMQAIQRRIDEVRALLVEADAKAGEIDRLQARIALLERENTALREQADAVTNLVRAQNRVAEIHGV
jgi:hypothetical protein